ncbi:MAG: shikimate dehydrogenase [Bacillota bacterium]
MMPTAATRLLGVLGHPVGHSLSPAMHNAALTCLGIDAVYLAFDVPTDGLARAFAGLSELQSPGWNVTAPLKAAAASQCNVLTPLAAALGAVNTVVRAGSQLVGHNTDVEGIQRALEFAGFAPDGRPGLVLGAGGAARAAAWALARLGTPVIIAARSEPVELAAGLRRAYPGLDVGAISWEMRDGIVPQSGVVINATPLGREDSLPVHPGLLAPGQVACDLVYGPAPTPWLIAARQAGARVADGREVLLYQGAAAFLLFTGRPAPLEVMRQALYGGEDQC